MLEFNTNDYFQFNRKYSEYFKVSSIATLSKSYKSSQEAMRLFELHKGEILSVTKDIENPYLKYKKVIQHNLWKNYEVISYIMLYSEKSSSEKEPLIKNVISKMNNEVSSILKQPLGEATYPMFDLQLNRIKKLFAKGASNKISKEINSKVLTEEFDKLILSMTLIHEFISKDISNSESDMDTLQFILSSLMHYVMFYASASEFEDSKERVVRRYEKGLKEESKLFSKIMVDGLFSNPMRIGQIETVFSTIKDDLEKYEDMFKGTKFEGLLGFSPVNYGAVRSVNRDYLCEMSNRRMTSVQDVLYQTVGSLYTMSGTSVTETDDFIFTRDDFYNAVGNLYSITSLNKVHFYFAISFIYHSLRVCSLVRSMESEMAKETTIQVVEIEKNQDSKDKLIKSQQEKINELTVKLELMEKVKKENEELKVANKRFIKELEQTSGDMKELKSLREFAFSLSNDSLPEEEEVDADLTINTDLPVILIGGRPKWAQKVKKCIPDLIHYNPDDQNTSVDKKLKSFNGIVLYDYGHNNHGMSYKVMPTILANDDIKFIPVKSNTNIGLLMNYINKELGE